MFLPLAFFWGLFFGSFANVLIHRLPRNLPTVWDRSRCPSCGHIISWYDNLPLLSFVFLKARSRCCRQPISWRYPAVELFMGLLFAANAWRYDFSLFLFLTGCSLALVLTVLSVIDYDHMILPDVLTLPLGICGLLVAAANPLLGRTPLERIVQSVLGLLTGGAILWGLALLGEAALKKEAMGGGDIKLLAALGTFLGWQGVLAVLFLSSMSGSVVGLALLTFRNRKRQDPLPFGPFLAAAGFLTFLFYEEWWRILFTHHFKT